MKQNDRRNNNRRNDRKRQRPEPVDLLALWVPTTKLGKMVKSGEIKTLDEVFAKGYTIMEPEVVDTLVPNLQTDLLLIGQAKGKFGGGQRRIFRQTQKKTREGNTIKFATCALVGNGNGYVGVAFGKVVRLCLLVINHSVLQNLT